MKSIIALSALFMAVLLFPLTGLADDLSAGDFLSQVLAFIQSFGGLASVAKIAGIVLLVIASMKVSFINTYVWSKLGAWQVLAAPVLGVVVGLLSVQPFSWPALFTYFVSGAGAIVLHEMLDAFKSFPGLGAIYVSIIDFLEKLLGAQPQNPPSLK